MKRLAVLVVLALFLPLMTPAIAYAYWYCYDYGVNWNQPPFNDSSTDYSAAGVTAAAAQNSRSSSYRANSYSTVWASTAWGNLCAARYLYNCSHGNAGLTVFYGLPTRTWTAGGQTYSSNMSCLRSTPVAPSHTHTVNSQTRQCNHYRDARTPSGTGVRLAVFQSCYSAATPSGYRSLSSQVYYSIVPCECSVGFTGLVSGRKPAAYTFSNKYWNDMADGWTVGNSLDRATAEVLRLWQSPCGFDTHATSGNAALVLD